jgi:hypothetical protein
MVRGRRRHGARRRHEPRPDDDRVRRLNRPPDNGRDRRGDGLGRRSGLRRRGQRGGRLRRRLRGDYHRGSLDRLRGRRLSDGGCGGCRRLREPSGGSSRQQRQRVHVPLCIARRAQAEVHVRLRVVCDAARPDSSDDRPFLHRRTARHGDRPEMEKSRCVSGRGLDRHGLPAGRHGAREGDDSSRRSHDLGPSRRAEIEPSVLAARIRMRAVEIERPQDRTAHGPRPRLRRGDRQSESNENTDSEPPHRIPPCCQF